MLALIAGGFNRFVVIETSGGSSTPTSASLGTMPTTSRRTKPAAC
jgi:hypothetical protein